MYKEVYDLVIEHLIDCEMIRETIFNVVDYKYKLGYEILEIKYFNGDEFIVEEYQQGRIKKQMTLAFSLTDEGEEVIRNAKPSCSIGRKSRRRR